MIPNSILIFLLVFALTDIVPHNEKNNTPLVLRETETKIPSLKEAFQNDFVIGTTYDSVQNLSRYPKKEAIILNQFNALTPENAMKSENLQPKWGQFDFTQADRIVKYCNEHGIRVNGHTLIWHSQLPSFVLKIQSADSLREFFTNHIKTVASHFDGKVYSWDVVNEALNEDGTLRNSIFLKKLGDNYIVDAFRLAQQASPHSKLYYNDYNIEMPQKRAGVIRLIKKIQEAGVRIDGVGIQGHWNINDLPFDEIEKSIQEYSSLGVKVMFTELDLSVLPNPSAHNTADIGNTSNYEARMDPYKTGLPDSVAQKQAEEYERLFKLFLKYKNVISRVTFWGVDDKQSWLNNFPVKGRTNYPLLFDRQLNPKPAFFSIIDSKK